jgi:hypothetical protein
MSRLKRFLRCWLNGHREYELNDLLGKEVREDRTTPYTYVMYCSECGKQLCGPSTGLRYLYVSLK